MMLVLMMLDARAGRGVIRIGIRMNVDAAIRPGSHPRATVNHNGMVRPAETDTAPAPRRIRSSNGDARPESNRAADIETRPWVRVHHHRIVIRNVIRIRHDGNDLDCTLVRNNPLVLVTPQIAVIIGLLAQLLYRIHYLVPLRQDGIAECLGPAHILRHVIQHAGKGQEGHDAGIKTQIVLPNGLRQVVTT